MIFATFLIVILFVPFPEHWTEPLFSSLSCDDPVAGSEPHRFFMILSEFAQSVCGNNNNSLY